MPVRLSVEAYPSDIFSGGIVNLSPSIDPQTRTFIVEADVTNNDLRLKPGFFIKGWVITDPNAQVLAVPQESLVIFAGVKKVFLLNGDRIRESLVQTGSPRDTWVEIVSGVTADDKVAVSSLIRLAEGVRVREAGIAEKSSEEGAPAPAKAPPRKSRQNE
jgi:membrane fusion protein (multidrug efflux system)